MSQKVENYTGLYNALSPNYHNKDVWMKTLTDLPVLSPKLTENLKRKSTSKLLLKQIILPSMPGQIHVVKKALLKSMNSQSKDHIVANDSEILKETNDSQNLIPKERSQMIRIASKKELEKIRKYSAERDKQCYAKNKNLTIETNHEKLGSDTSTDVNSSDKTGVVKLGNYSSAKNAYEVELNKSDIKSPVFKIDRKQKSNFFMQSSRTQNYKTENSVGNDNVMGTSKPKGLTITLESKYSSKDEKSSQSNLILDNKFFAKSLENAEQKNYPIEKIHSIINKRKERMQH